jgi:hypothetical protein
VIGIANAQYVLKVGCTTWALSHFSIGMANRVAKKVGGRNTIVTMAIVFIE